MTDILKDELITYEQAAAKLGCSPKSIKRWADKGLLEIVRVGKSPRTTWAAVNAYLNRHAAQQEVVAPEKPPRKATPKGLKRSADRARGALALHGMKSAG